MNIFLIGYRCTGKSTLGKLLATLLKFDFVDIDRDIESEVKTSIQDLVTNKGWQYFRQVEKKILFQSATDSNRVIATGGGIVLDPENRSFIQKNGFCIWLVADPDIIVKRMIQDKANKESRPKFTDSSLEFETKEMIKTRYPLYRELAQLTIDTNRHVPAEAADLIKRRLDHGRL